MKAALLLLLAYKCGAEHICPTFPFCYQDQVTGLWGSEEPEAQAKVLTSPDRESKGLDNSLTPTVSRRYQRIEEGTEATLVDTGVESGVSGLSSKKGKSGQVARLSTTGVISCGGHQTDACLDCGTSASYCNGDCKWLKHENKCNYKYLSGFRKEVLQAHNVYRAQNGKSPLRLNSAMSANAQKWAEYLADSGKFFHQDLDTQKWAENIASASDRFPDGRHGPTKQWIGSAGHRKNILGDYVEIGIGLGQHGGGAKTVAVFRPSWAPRV